MLQTLFPRRCMTWLATTLAVNWGCMGREFYCLYYSKLWLFSLSAFFCSSAASPECSGSGSLSPRYPPFFSQWPADGRSSSVPQSWIPPLCPTWLRTAPHGEFWMAAWFAEKQRRLWLLFLLFMTEGTGWAKHFVLSRECSRTVKWLSRTHPGEEPYVMQTRYNSGTLCNPTNTVQPQRL